jgi:hypothetical protein
MMRFVRLRFRSFSPQPQPLFILFLNLNLNLNLFFFFSSTLTFFFSSTWLELKLLKILFYLLTLTQKYCIYIFCNWAVSSVG